MSPSSASSCVFYAVGKSASPPAAPTIITQPTDKTGALGDTVTLSIATSNLGSQPQIYWYHDGVQVDFGNNPSKYFVFFGTGSNAGTLQVKNLANTDAGSYYLTVVTPGGMFTSNAFTLTVVAPSQPAITTQPVSATIAQNGGTSFNVVATGGGLTYQWMRDSGSGYVNAVGTSTSSTYNVNNVAGGSQAAGTFSYKVVITNSIGTVTSNVVTLTVTSTAPVAPTISSNPQSVTVAPGSTAVFSVSATGTPPFTFAWYNGTTLIGGATGPRYVVTNPSAGGVYSAKVTNSAGTATSNAGTLTVTPTSNPGRLINLSVLSPVQGSLAMGYVIGGSGVTGNQSLLIRATGPALALPPFNVPGVMAQPVLTVIKQAGSVTLATNAGWGSNQAAVTTTDAAVGAFALSDPTSKDSALVTSLPVSVGGYTANVASATGGSGYALTEVYDATAAGAYTATTPRLINLSCLTQVALGGTLNVGFVIGGSTAKTVLIRVSGPTLAQAPFNIAGTMPNPKLTVQPLNSSSVVAFNSGWNGDAQIAAAASSVGAFALFSGTSLDSASLVTLPAGPYTVTATSVNGASGWVLVEIYEVP